MRGEISPGQEAAQLIDSLDSRLGRRQLKDSLAATRHFLQSLKTPNDELRYKNSFDHSDVYRKLPAAERDFVYQRAVLQKEGLESKLRDNEPDRQKPIKESVQKPEITTFSEFREELKSEILELVRMSGRSDHNELTERAVSILEASVAKDGLAGKADYEAINALSREFSERIGKASIRSSTNHSRTSGPIPERVFEDTSGRQYRTREIYTR